MTRSVFKPFVSTLTAAAIVLGMASSPAAALGKKEKDVLGALVGLGAVAIIIDGLSKDNPPTRVAPSARGWDDRREWREHKSKKVIPSYCVDDLKSRHARWDRIEVVSERCVERGDRRVNLPRACEIELTHVDFDRRRNDYRDRRGLYELRCLERHGYRVERRR